MQPGGLIERSWPEQRCAERGSRVGALAAAFVVLAFAAPAMANPGSAGWSVIFHIVLGNLVIGVVEGVVAIRLGARWWAVPLLIATNYGSAIAGLWIANPLFDGLLAMWDADPLRAALPVSWSTIGILAALGLLVEFPLFVLCFIGRGPVLRRAIKALLIGNAITVAGLMGWYSLTWADSLATDLTPVESPAELTAHSGAPWVYYIEADDRTIARVRLDGSEYESIMVWPAELPMRSLCACRNPDGVYAIGVSGHGRAPSGVSRPEWLESPGHEFVMGVVSQETAHAASLFAGPEFVAPGGLPYAADLRPVDQRHTELHPHWDGVHGLTITTAGVKRSLALDNGLIQRSFTPIYVSALPGDIIVFELNHENEHLSRGIYVADLAGNRIARLAAGRSPIVAYDEDVPGWEPPAPRDR